MWTKIQLFLVNNCSRIVNVLGTGTETATPTVSDQDLGKNKIKNLQQAANGFHKIVKNVLAPILTIIGVLAVIYVIYLGVMFARAESADKRKELQGRLIGACIGAVIMIAGATLCFAIDWAQLYHKFATGHYIVDANADGVCDTCAVATKS